MPEYKVFLKPASDFGFLGYFTTETQADERRTVFVDMNGDEKLVLRYEKKPTESFVDERTHHFSALNPREVYRFARKKGAKGGLGRKDLKMPEATAGLLEKRYNGGLRLMEWKRYAKMRVSA